MLSFSDLMASLLAIFILALVAMMVQLYLQKRKLEEDRKSFIIAPEDVKKIIQNKNALEEERKKIQIILEELRKSLDEIEVTQRDIINAIESAGLREKSLERMLEGIQRELEKKGIKVLVAENGTVLRIPENALSFKLSEYNIDDLYKKSADAIGATLLESLQKSENRKLLDTVFIEGHTDSVPNRREMGNWGLSTYRAISLWQHWTENPGRFSQLKSLKTAVREEGSIERPLISTSGYADTRPANLSKVGFAIAKTNTIGNPADRRIDIRFTLASSEKKDLSQLKNKLNEMKSKTNDLIKKLKEVE